MKQFIITEQEKYNILKQYGLFEQNKTYPYNRPGDKYYMPPTGPFVPPSPTKEKKTYTYPYNRPSDKYYMPPTGPFVPPPTKEEWEDWLITMYEPRIKIPIPILGEIKMSVMDITSIFANIIPIIGPYVSLALDASSTVYFASKGNNYEAGLRALFMIIPGLQLPIVQKFGKEKLIKLLARVENLKEDVNLASNLSKEEMKDIVYLFRYFKQNKESIKLILSKSAKLTMLMGHITEKLTGITIAKFMGVLYRLYKINPKHHLFTKSSKVLIKIFTEFGVFFGVSKGWDSFWNKYASDEQKAKKHSYDNQKIDKQTTNELVTEMYNNSEDVELREKAMSEIINAFEQRDNKQKQVIKP